MKDSEQSQIDIVEELQLKIKTLENENRLLNKIANDFFMMFCRGRKDVYELRCTNPKTGKNGYKCFG